MLKSAIEKDPKETFLLNYINAILSE